MFTHSCWGQGAKCGSYYGNVTWACPTSKSPRYRCRRLSCYCVICRQKSWKPRHSSMSSQRGHMHNSMACDALVKTKQCRRVIKH